MLFRAIFLQFGPCWWSAQFLPYSAIFAQLPVAWKESTSNNQCDNVILIEKGIDATPHASLWLLSCQEYRLLQKDAVQYCPWNWWAYPSHVISASTCCSCQPSISLQEWLTTVRCGLRSGKSLHVTICVKKSLGSRTRHRFVFVTYLLNRCHYCTSTWDRPWHDVGGWLVVTKADCDLGL